jgi:DMSO/TMAO reductase YedYZ heme-binding membrane subunit
VNGLPFVAAVTAVIAAIAAFRLAILGYGEEWLGFVLRLTARSSLALFSGAFLASALRRVSKNAASAWLRRNRRYWGLAFAASHTIHLAAIFALAAAGIRYEAATLAIGGVGYVFIGLLALTSNDASVARLGPDWRRLHTIGVYYLWFVFAATYAASFPAHPPSVLALPWLLFILGFRLWALHGRKRSRP